MKINRPTPSQAAGAVQIEAPKAHVVEPFGDQLLLSIPSQVAEKKAVAGNFLPEGAQTALCGEILAAGQGFSTVQQDADGALQLDEQLRAHLVGRIAFYRTGTGFLISHNGEQFVIVSAEDLLATAAP